MIDFHSHILPAIDDGSRDVKESVQLLLRLSKQGIDKVIATPHFYADNESVEEFFKRRKASFDMLKPELKDNMPEILLGAEVKYYQGISHLDNLKDLCIQNSNLLLLEMPFCRWTEYTVKELTQINNFSGITVVLAHIERYLKFGNAKFLEELLQCGMLMQANASFFLDFSTRLKALRMLKKNMIQLIGSDCHGMNRRPPHIGKAIERISKKMGYGFVEYISDYENNLLNSNRSII